MTVRPLEEGPLRVKRSSAISIPARANLPSHGSVRDTEMDRRMKIASADVLGVGCELTGEHTFVRLTTEDGITGLGQSGGWGYPKGVAAMLGELRPLLIGADPFRIEHLWHLAYRARPFRGNLLSAAVSAIDLALWDIKGKALERAGLGAARRPHARPRPAARPRRRRHAGRGRLVGQLGGRGGLHGGQVRPARPGLRGPLDRPARQLGLRDGCCGP